MSWDITSHEGDTQGSAIPRRHGSSSGNLARFAPGRQKNYGIPFTLPRKATFKREPQHRPKSVLNRTTE